MIDSRICWRVIGLLLLIGAAQAEPGREQPFAEMDHKTWTARDGAPQGISALAQGADGTLWIGSDSGLFNFDGRTFTPFQSPASETELPVDAVRTLCVARDGTLWVGFFDAGVARIEHGRVTVYSMIGDHRLRVMDDLREASDGSIWGASSQSHIVRFGADDQGHQEPCPSIRASGPSPSSTPPIRSGFRNAAACTAVTYVSPATPRRTSLWTGCSASRKRLTGHSGSQTTRALPVRRDCSTSIDSANSSRSREISDWALQTTFCIVRMAPSLRVAVRRATPAFRGRAERRAAFREGTAPGSVHATARAGRGQDHSPAS